MRICDCLIALSALLASGCGLLVDLDDTKGECGSNDDCPSDEICAVVEGRCVLRGIGALDASARLDATRLDAKTYEWGIRDARVDTASPDDVLDAALSDARPDVEPEADLLEVDEGSPFDWGVEPDAGEETHFNGGLGCFEGDSGRLISLDGAHIPQSLCTPELQVWTFGLNDRVYFNYLEAPDAPEVAEWDPLLPPIMNNELSVVGDRVTWVAYLDALEGMKVVSWTPDTPLKILGGSRRDDLRVNQRQPDYDNETYGFVERRLDVYPEYGGVDEVVLYRGDDETPISCHNGALEGEGFTDYHQWGLDITARGVFFFERRLGQDSARLIINQDGRCEARFEIPLNGLPPHDARIHVGRDRLVWIQSDSSDRAHLMTLKLSEAHLGAAAIARVEGILNPVEVDVHGAWAAATVFTPRGHTLKLIHLGGEAGAPTIVDEDVVGAPQGSHARYPRLNPHYLIWSQQTGLLSWEIRYAALPVE